MTAEIIAIGSELLTPFRQDTNSLFLTDQLNQLGVEVTFKSVVGDNRAHLVSVARIALSRADIVIFMGGLGPTEDDLTRESVSEAMVLPLRRDADIVAELYARFAARRIKMPDNNLRQADVLTGAAVLKNGNGTAPGQYLEGEYAAKKLIVILLPGPPYELKPMFAEQCVPRLRAKLPPRSIAARVLKVAMMPESECDARIAPIYKEHNAVQTTILAHAGEIQIQLRAEAETLEEAQQLVDDLAEELEDELEERIYSTRGESLEQIVGYYLQMRNSTLASAESCTGGMLAERITSVPGSSRYFLGGAVVYDNDLKSGFADVPKLLIAEHGAVSKQVALALADGIRKRCKASIGVGITGIAGPGGGTPEKPVGLVYIAVNDGNKPEAIERRFTGDRERVRQFATQLALDMIRRKLI
jgi:nicotinamide-nucleotide amidase